jgi:transglutaminase superfamily protein
MSTPASAVSSAPAPLPLVAKVALATEILAAYARTRLWLVRGDFRHAVGGLRAAPANRPVSGDPVIAGRRLGSAVVRTLRLLPTDSRCLMRSLVLTRLLARRGIASTLVIGVRSGESFEAHAWVEHAGAPLLHPGDPGFRRLAEL